MIKMKDLYIFKQIDRNNMELLRIINGTYNTRKEINEKVKQTLEEYPKDQITIMTIKEIYQR